MGTDPIFLRAVLRDGKWGLSPFIAGAATVLAFAPFHLHPVAMLSFALLAHLWMRATPGRAAWLGFWFGFGLFGAGVSWIFVSLSQFGGLPAPVAALATLLFCAFIALFPAAAGWLQARVPASDAARACVLIPAAWVLLEWLRGWILTGFPWLSVGYSAAGWPLQGYAPLGGVYAVSFIAVSIAGMLYLLVLQKRLALAVAAVAILGAGEGLRRVPWTTPEGEPVAAALLQGNIEQEMKFRPERYARILETYARLAEETRARLIILPETAVPRFLDQVDPAYLARLQAAAKRNDGDLLLGVPFRASREYYNSVVTLGASPAQLYHKSHLVPLGEFVPWGFRWLLDRMSIPLSDFSRGAAGQPLLAVAGQRIAANVCYEDAFGDEIASRLPEATLLVNLSNVAWFGDSLAPAQHLQIAQLRAIETGRMHLAATNTGVTAAIDRDGRVLARLPQYTEARLEVQAQGYAGATPYVRLRDWPAILVSLGALGLFVFRARMTR